MRPENAPEEEPEGRPQPEPTTDPALRRRRIVLGSLFGLAVLAVVVMTVVLANAGGTPEKTAAGVASSAAAPGTTSVPQSPAASPSVSSPAPSKSSASPSARAGGNGSGTSTAGWPSSGNTGTPRGISLHTCPTKITKTASFDRCKFPQGVEVRADNVHITRSLITGQVDAGESESDQHGLVITDTTIDCGCLSDETHAPAAISYSNFTLRRVNILNSGHGAALDSNVVIQDSYIHGQGANTDAHKDGIYVGNGSNVVLRHNNIECNDGSHAGCTAAIGLLTDFGNISNWVIDDNLLNTNGAYCIYGSGGPSKNYSSNHITITNNHFGQLYNSKCGADGPVTYFDKNAAGNVWRNNVWANSGKQVGPEY
jgi:hypothetical protein